MLIEVICPTIEGEVKGEIPTSISVPPPPKPKKH